ncbi:MAG: TonB family protein [Bacteroidota bacterium]
MKQALTILTLLLIISTAYGQTDGVGEYKYVKRNRIPNGYWEYYHKNGNVHSSGNYSLGIEVGVWSYYHENGKLSKTGAYENGLKTGKWTYYDENGVKTSEGAYNKNARMGTWNNWDSLGYKISFGEYIADKKSGSWKYFYAPNGEKKEVGEFVKGEKKGNWVKWYRNGEGSTIHNCDQKVYTDKTEVAEQCFLVNQYDSLGTQLVVDGNGQSIYFHDNGTMEYAGLIKDGKREGEWKHYSNEGRLLAIDKFKNGTLVSGISYDSLGNAYEYGQFVEMTHPEDGFEKFYRFVGKNLKYPAPARRQGIQGKVYVQFIIAKDGKVEDIEVVKGIGGGCDEEAQRVMELSVKRLPWIPRCERGQTAKNKIILPLTFKLG